MGLGEGERERMVTMYDDEPRNYNNLQRAMWICVMVQYDEFIS
jgi:hypothetical protein